MSRSRRQTKSDLAITGDEAGRIGGRIRQVRGTASQRQFAGRIGITREQLSRIESGAQVPGTETLRRMAQAARVSLDWVLLGGASHALRASAPEEGGFAAALRPLLAATTLRLTAPSAAAARRADRAWAELPDEGREDVRALVRRLALIALAIEALLPARAARGVIAELSAAAAALVVDRIVAASGRPVS
jgi:transcriptional regulator with XRE-family HTH domain